MKYIKGIIRGFQVLGIVALTLLLASNLYMIAVRTITGNSAPTVFGFHWAVVMSGSMEPAIHVDDLVISKVQSEYQVGDIIIFFNGHNLITHRIVEQKEQGFVTQGDANNVADQELVSAEDIVGKVIFLVPKVGAVIYYMKTPMGTCFMLLLGIALVGSLGLIRNKDSEG